MNRRNKYFRILILNNLWNRHLTFTISLSPNHSHSNNLPSSTKSRRHAWRHPRRIASCWPERCCSEGLRPGLPFQVRCWRRCSICGVWFLLCKVPLSVFVYHWKSRASVMAISRKSSSIPCRKTSWTDLASNGTFRHRTDRGLWLIILPSDAEWHCYYRPFGQGQCHRHWP